MCLAIPGQVISIKGTSAVISVMGVLKEVSIELLKEVKVGDYLIVHAGCAISILDEQEALKTLRLFEELGEVLDE